MALLGHRNQVPMNQSQLNEFMCGQFNRKGRLCGECKEGYSPLAYSYNMHCVKCSSKESTRNIFFNFKCGIHSADWIICDCGAFTFNGNSIGLCTGFLSTIRDKNTAF